MRKNDKMDEISTLNEYKYWLRLVSGKYIEPECLADEIKEVQELIKILSAIIKTKSPKA